MSDKKKMGRPTDNPRDIKFQVRMTKDEREKLELCAKITNKTKTEIVNIGIDKVYKELMNTK